MTEEEAINLKKFIDFCDSEFGKKVLKAEADFIRKELHRNAFGKMLDVGCGIGAMEQYLADLDITGVDVSQVFLKEARRRNPEKKFVRAKADELPFRDSSFDAVISITTLEFLENLTDVIREISRVLKPSGKIVVLMLNPHSDYVKKHKKKKKSYFNRMKYRSVMQIRGEMLDYFDLTERKFFLGISGSQILGTENEKWAALVCAVGKKRE